jgi:hypothetical protein
MAKNLKEEGYEAVEGELAGHEEGKEGECSNNWRRCMK